jgi:hypothetical protein
MQIAAGRDAKLAHTHSATTMGLRTALKADAHLREQYEGQAFGKTVFGRLTCCDAHAEESAANQKAGRDTSTPAQYGRVCGGCGIEMPLAQSTCC